jgi:hypothetical protein
VFTVPPPERSLQAASGTDFIWNVSLTKRMKSIKDNELVVKRKIFMTEPRDSKKAVIGN